MRLRIHLCLAGNWRFRVTEIGSMRITMSSKTLDISWSSTKRPKSTHLLPEARCGLQATSKGTHCRTKATVMARHQIRQITNTMSVARLNRLIVKTLAYQVSMVALASVMPHMKKSSPIYSSCELLWLNILGKCIFRTQPWRSWRFGLDAICLDHMFHQH